MNKKTTISYWKPSMTWLISWGWLMIDCLSWILIDLLWTFGFLFFYRFDLVLFVSLKIFNFITIQKHFLTTLFPQKSMFSCFLMASKCTEIAATNSPTSCMEVSFTLPSKRVSEWNNFFKFDWLNNFLNWFWQRHHFHLLHLSSLPYLFNWLVQKFRSTISRLIFSALT